MAGTQRNSDDHLIELLAKKGPEADFFRAVQLIHRLAPNAPAVGQLGPVIDEPIQFRHDPSFAFEASDISRIDPKIDGLGRLKALVVTTFLGLTGASSPLASYIGASNGKTQIIRSRMRAIFGMRPRFHAQTCGLM